MTNGSVRQKLNWVSSVQFSYVALHAPLGYTHVTDKNSSVNHVNAFYSIFTKLSTVCNCAIFFVKVKLYV